MGGCLAAQVDDKHVVKFVFPFLALAYQQDTTSAHSLHMSGKGTLAPDPLLLLASALHSSSRKIWEPLHHCKPGQGAPIQTRCAGPRFSLPTGSLCVQ